MFVELTHRLFDDLVVIRDLALIDWFSEYFGVLVIKQELKHFLALLIKCPFLSSPK